MIRIKEIIIVLFLFFTGSIFSTELKLYKEAFVQGRCATLKDLGNLKIDRGQDLLLFERACLFSIPKKAIYLTQTQIKKVIFHKTGLKLNLIGDGIIIQPLYTRILPQEIRAKIKTAATKKYPFLNIDQIRVIFLDKIKSFRVPFGMIEVKAYLPGGKFGRTKYSQIQIWLDNKIYYSKGFRIKLNAMLKVAVAKRKIRKREPITYRKIRFVNKRITRNPEIYFIYKNKQPYKRLKKSIYAGQILLKRYLN